MRGVSRSFVLGFLTLSLSACAVQWVSDYDEKTDDAITKLQKTTTAFFEDLKSKSAPECFYSNNHETYKAVYVDALALLTRARAVDGGKGLNRRTVYQAEQLLGAYDDIRDSHERRGDVSCLADATFENAQVLMNQALTAMLTTELFKKREFVKGSKKDESTSPQTKQDGQNGGSP